MSWQDEVDELKKVAPFSTISGSFIYNSIISHLAELCKNEELFPFYISANMPQASEHNERNSIIIKNNDEKIIVVQIAGLIARRILSFISEGHKIDKGERIGLIRFGSRVDIYLPPSYEIKVNHNDIVIAGETIIAER